MALKLRLLHIFIAIDQLVYVLITLGRGSPLETCSAAAYRIELEHGWFSFTRPVIDLLFWPLEKDHCRLAFENLQNMKYLPEAYQR